MSIIFISLFIAIFIHFHWLFGVFLLSSRKMCFSDPFLCFSFFPFVFLSFFSFLTIHVDEKSGKGKNKFEIENISRNLWNLWGNFPIFHFFVLKVNDNLCFVLTIHKNTVFCLFFPFRSNKKERSTTNQGTN